MLNQAKWEKQVKYLGVRFSVNYADLYHLNVEPLITQMKLQSNTWSKLGLSWMGHVAAIKMKVLS